MSTVSTSRPQKPPADDSDPFRYGWRYVTVQQPDGTKTVDQIPLTLEDVLFPEEDDFIVQTDLHDTDTSYLKYVFNARLADRPRAWTVSDCRVDWNLPGVRPLGPDIAMFFDVDRRGTGPRWTWRPRGPGRSSWWRSRRRRRGGMTWGSRSTSIIAPGCRST